MEEKSMYEEVIENAKYFKGKDGKLDEKAYHDYLARTLTSMCNFAIKYMGISKKEMMQKLEMWRKQKDPEA